MCSSDLAKIAGKLSRELIRDNDDRQLKEMASKGAKINATPNVAAFRKSVESVYVKAKEKYGADLDAIMADAAQIRSSTK